MNRDDEACLTVWMDINARVGWVVAPEPWTVKRDLIHCLDSPLNIAGAGRLFASVLKALRASVCSKLTRA